MRIVLHNISPRQRTAWTRQIAVPLATCTIKQRGTFKADDGRRFMAVRGEDIGSHSATFRIRATMNGDERLMGELTDEDPGQLPWQTHKWVLDDLAATFPMATLVDGGGTIHYCDYHLNGPDLVSFSEAHQRWYVKSANPQLGLVEEVYADLLLGDPVVHLWGAVTWSNRLDTARTKMHRGLFGLVSGEQLALDFATRHGWRYTEFMGKKAVLMAQDPAWIDGGSYPFSGSILCFRGPTGVDGPWNPDGQDEQDIKNLEAAKYGPIVGILVGYEWDGHWLSTGIVPKVPQRFTDQDWASFAAAMEQPAGLFAPRPIGCAPYPGQTGDQEDFGATKGARALLWWEPRWIYQLQYSVQAEFFRGVRHFEADGTSLDPARHPNWETWGGRTGYYIQPPSPDSTLGKESGYWPENPMGGFAGYDDEHHSQNNWAAYIALSGDPMLTTQWLHQSTVDVCSYTVRKNATGPMRAEGRLSQSWANMALLVPGEALRRALYMLGQRIALADSHPLINQPGPMKVMAFHGPDSRKPIYDDAGNLVSSVTMWELGLQLVGLASVVASQPGTSTVAFTHLARTMANYGCYQSSDGSWRVTSDVEWRNGSDVDLLQAEKLPNGYKVAIFDTNAGDVRSWTMAGLIVARSVLQTIEPDLFAKINTCMEAMQINLSNPPDQRLAEWWATVRV